MMLVSMIVSWLTISSAFMYGLVFLLLMGDFWFPYRLLNSSGVSVRLLVGGGWVALPVFCSGIVFSNSFKQFVRPAEALGMNLFGAVLGGVLENAVMVGGTPILRVLAIALYAAAATALWLSSARSLRSAAAH